MLNANIPANKEITTIGCLKFVTLHLLKYHTLLLLVGTEDSRFGTLNSALSTASRHTHKTSMLFASHHSVTTSLLVVKTPAWRFGTSTIWKHQTTNTKLVLPSMLFASIQKCSGLPLVLKMVLRFGISTVIMKHQLLTLLVNHSRKSKRPRDQRLHHVPHLLGMLLVISCMLVSTMDTSECTTYCWKMPKPMNDFV